MSDQDLGPDPIDRIAALEVEVERLAEERLPPSLDLEQRVALRPAEAARVLGISPRHLKKYIRELPTVRFGNAVLIPLEPLKDFLRARARMNDERSDGELADLIGGLDVD